MSAGNLLRILSNPFLIQVVVNALRVFFGFLGFFKKVTLRVKKFFLIL